MGYLLDTSVAIHLRDDNEAALLGVAALDGLPVISALTQAELEGGVAVDPERSVRRRSGLDLFLATFPVLQFTGASAAIYGRIVSRSGFSRRKAIDRMIAATALEHDLYLITTNAGDFLDIDRLKLKTWTL